MIRAPKSLREVNSFEFVAIPSARDIFNRFGYSKPTDCFTTDSSEVGVTVVQPGSVIGQMIRCQEQVELNKSSK